jgi:predicted O-methyltransferase YrrM
VHALDRLTRAVRHPIRTARALHEIRNRQAPFDQHPPPSRELVDIAAAAISAARLVDLSRLAARAQNDLQRGWFNQWPGEHYRLLRALVETLDPDLVVEVGTFTGMGTLTLAGANRRIVTYDIIPWHAIPDSLLRDSDFGSVEQRLGDLSDPEAFRRERALLADADLIFVDAPKNAVFEPAFLPLLLPTMKSGALLVLDDIRFRTMAELWRDLPLPKLDMTAFGHVSGTGLALKP